MYSMKEYQPEYRGQVLELLRFVWGCSADEAERNFKWKHELNPFPNNPIGIVALCDNRVVGFRGLIAAEYRLEARPVRLLAPADAGVHPDYRRQGLFTLMTEAAMNACQDRFQFFLNLTSNQASGPGNLKMGWQPLGPKTYLRRLSPLAAVGVRSELSSANSKRLYIGSNPDIFAPLVADFLARPPDCSVCQLVRSEEFIRWRFACPSSSYLFLVKQDAGATSGFLALRTTGSSANIVDYAEQPGSGAIESLLKTLVKLRSFRSISILNVSFSPEMKDCLRTHHFHKYDLLERIVKRRRVQFPMLLRPVRQDYSDSDWLIQGRDMRVLSNWKLTGISADTE